jgi:hypothetical protein
MPVVSFRTCPATIFAPDKGTSSDVGLGGHRMTQFALILFSGSVPGEEVQSTRPVWGATYGIGTSRSLFCFNPRAPHGARIHRSGPVAASLDGFNPRAPSGARRFYCSSFSLSILACPLCELCQKQMWGTPRK